MWLTEMSEGLPSTQEQESNNESDEETEYRSINPPAKNMKKDQKQRRKQKEQKLLEKLKQDAKIEKKKIADIYKLKKINNIIDKQEKKAGKLKEKRLKKKEYSITEPKQLGRVKFEDPDLEFHLGSEISGNLKNLKPEGSILRDRFKSLQKRNILQATVKQPPRKKAKFKKFEKASHKMGWEPKGY